MVQVPPLGAKQARVGCRLVRVVVGQGHEFHGSVLEAGVNVAVGMAARADETGAYPAGCLKVVLHVLPPSRRIT